MKYLADPVLAQTAAPYDDADLRQKLKILADNEAVDDKFASDLEAAIKAIKIPDLSPYALKSEIPSAIAPKAEIEPIFDLLSPPSPIIAPAIMNGATLVSGVTGSPMVNGGKVHTFGRLSTPPAPNTWNTTLAIAPTIGACKLRFAIASAIQGTIEVSIDGAAPLTASNIGFGWSGTTPAIVAFQNPDFTWFEVAIAQSNNPQSVKVTIPTGRGQLPTIYNYDAITSLIPAQPTGLKLRAMPGGETLEYRPSAFAKPSDLPKPFDPTAINNRIGDVEYGLSFVSMGVVAFSSELNLTTQLNQVHPAGGLYKEFITQNEGRAIDLTLGSNITASTFKTELGVPQTDKLVRVKAGTMDTIIANASLIPAGLYRCYYLGGFIRLVALDSV